MPTITVSSSTLREKARAIRKILDDQKTAHQQLWTQMKTQVSQLPADLRSSHRHANNT